MARFTPPPADATRARILDAARDEFAAAGRTGSRIERIGAASGTNKAQIFHYFGGKEQLFDAVLAQAVGDVFRAVPIDVDDLAEWAGRLHDHAVRHPEVGRLLTWHRLESGAGEPLAEVVERNRESVAAVEHAQRAGVVARSYRPAVLLALIVHLAGLWDGVQPEFAPLLAVTPARRRQTVVDAVSALV